MPYKVFPVDLYEYSSTPLSDVHRVKLYPPVARKRAEIRGWYLCFGTGRRSTSALLPHKNIQNHWGTQEIRLPSNFWVVYA